MNKKTISIFCFCFLLTLSSFSQKLTIYGKILDANSKGIQGASLIIFNQQKKILSYSFTNKFGDYNLEFNNRLNDTLTLEISSLGYKKIENLIKIDKLNLNFILEEKTEILNEVVIKSGKKIIIKQDTTSIKVEGFTNKTEQTVEDVLKKIPGIVINKDGSISAHGKPIDKLLIEGEDIFASNYKILTKNLDAKVLDVVQIIDNYEDNPIFKTLNNTDKVALNLKLKKELANVWFGNVILGGSVASKGRWKESLTVGLLKKKIKSFYFGDYNNLGEKTTDLFASENVIKNIFSNDQYEYKAKSIFNIGINEVNLFSKTQSAFNEALLNSFSFSSKINKKLSIRGGFYLASDNQFQASASSTKYNLGNNPVTFNENSEYRNKIKRYSAEIEIKYKVNSKNYVTNFFIVKQNPNVISNDLLFNTSQIIQKIKSNINSFYNHFNHTVRISESMILNNYLYIGNSKILENVEIKSPPLNKFLNIDTTKNINQNANNNVFFIGLKSKLITKLKKIDLTNTFCIESNKEKFSNTFLADNLNISIYENYTSLNTFNITQDNTLRYNFSKKIDLTSSLNLQSSNLQISNFNNSNFSKNVFFINPSFNLNIKKTGFGNFSLSYSKSNALPEVNQLTKNFNLVDYRSFILGTTYKNVLRSETFSFNYNYFNDEKRYSFNSSVYYTDNKSILNTSSDISNDFIFNSYIQTKGAKSYNINTNVVNYSRWLKLASKIEIKNSIFNTPVNANSNEFSISKGLLNIIKYSGTTYFKLPINFGFNISYNYFKSTFQEIKNSNETYEGALNINYRLLKTFIIESNNSVYYINKNKYFFNNIIVNYTPLKSKFSFRFVLNNLANENEYRYISINNYVDYQYSIELVPRYILGTVKYRF